MDWVNQLQKVNNKFKFQLFGKSIQNLNTCYINIQKFDETGARVMTSHVFNLYLNSFGVFLTTQQIRIIKQNFSQGDKIKYLDFIDNVRNDITPKRLATVDWAFQQLSNGIDVVKLADLLSRFDANRHPHVRAMVKSPEKVWQDFESAIKSRSADQININQCQFKDFFLDVNACFPLQRQQYFIDLILNGLRLNNNRVSNDRLKKMEVLLYEKVRQRTYLKKDQGLKSTTAFRFFDMQDKGVVDYKRFKQSIEKLGCGFTEKQTKALFEKHSGSTLLMSYEQMCALLFEMGSGLKDNTNPLFELSKKQGFVTSAGMTKTFK